MPQNCSKSIRPGNDKPLRVRTVLFRTAALALLILCLLPASGRAAACFGGERVLHSPAPEKGQAEAVFSVLTRAAAQSGAAMQLRAEPGRGGGYALSALLRAGSDSCQLAGLLFPSYLTMPLAGESLYQEQDTSPLLIFAGVNLALWVEDKSPFTSVYDLIRYFRTIEGKPGGVLRLAGSGRYTDQHMAALIFERQAGVKVAYMPGGGVEESAELVRRGEAQACWAYALAPSTMPGMRPLAVAGMYRSPALPDTPTFNELDIPLERVTWFGLAMSAAVAEPARRETARDMLALLADPAARQALATLGCAPVAVGYDSMPDFVEQLRKETAQFLEDFRMLPPRRR